MAIRSPRESVLRACDRLLACGLPLGGTVAAVGVIDTPAEIELHRIPLADA